MIRYFFAYILEFPLIFATINVWDKLFSLALDDKLQEEGTDVLSKAEFPKFFQAAQSKFPTLTLCQAASWTELVNIIMRQTIRDTSFDWMFPICQILRYGNYKRLVDYDAKSVSWGTDRDDQIMKVDIIKNLGHHDAKFDHSMDYFLAPFQGFTPPSQEGLSDSIGLKDFALMFGDGFITNELDTTGEELEGGSRNVAGKLLYKLLHKAELKIKELKLEKIVDLYELRKFSEVIKKSLAFTHVLESCKKHSRPFELFEDIMINQLRAQAPGEEFLIATGFTEHAMLVSFKRNAGKYNVSVYNSGSGIQYHESTNNTRLKKFSPLMQFTSIPLARLKNSGFIRRLVEIDSNGQPTFSYSSRAKVDSESDMYENVVNVLKPYETHLKGVGPNLKNLVKSQRSGTCAWRCYMVCMASKLDNFRLIKLIMSKIALTLALRKTELNPDASPVARRLVKFALENYARSVERFGKFDDFEKSFDLGMFGDDQFWDQYEKYAGVWPYNRTREFRIELAEPTPAGLGLPYEALLHSSMKMDNLFGQLSKTGIDMPVRFFKDYELHQKALFNDFQTVEEFAMHLNSMDTMTSQSWTGTPDLDKLAFLVSTILYRWPLPSKSNSSIYAKLFDETPKGEVAQKSLFRIAKNILGLMYTDLKWFPQIEFALTKILAIYHQLLVKIHKPFSKLISFDSTDKWDSFCSITANGSIDYQLLELGDQLKKGNATDCFDFSYKVMKKGPKNILADYLKSKMVEIEFAPGDSLSGSVMKVFSKRLHEAFPAALYYWRDMRFILTALDGEVDSETGEVSTQIPFINQIHLHDPFSSCDLEDLNPDTTCFSRSYNLTSKNWTHEIIENVLVDSSVELEGFQAHEFQFRRYYKVAGQTDLQTNVSDSFAHTSRTVNGNYYLGLSFMSILDECRQDIKFNEMMYFGGKLTFSELSIEMVEAIVKLMMKNIDLDLIMLENNSVNSLKDQIKLSERIAGLIIATCYLSSRKDNQCLVELSELRRRIFFVGMKEGRDESLVFLQLGFLASAQPILEESFSLEESSKLILMNQKFVNSSKLLPEHFRFESLKFTVSLNVAHAVTAYYKKCEDKKQYQKVSLIPLQANQPVYPWVLTTPGRYIDLVSGINYSPAGSVSKSLDGKSRKLLKKVKLEQLESRIEETYTSFKLGFVVTTVIPKPNTKWVLDGVEFDTHLDILQIDLVKSDHVLCRLFLSNGYVAYNLPKQHIISWKNLPIPATANSETPYDIWCFPMINQIWFISESGVVVAKDGLTYLPNESLKKMASSVSAFPHSIPLSSNDMVEVFYGDFGRVFLFKNLVDFGGNRLIFTQRDTESKWVYKNNGQYWISSNQEFKTSSYIKYSLVIESKENTKVFIPIMHVKVSRANLDGNDRSTTQQKKCLLFDLSPEDLIEPKSILEYLLLVYHYLIARNYLLSFEALMRVHQMESFGDEELRLLGWIISSHDDNLDGSPESCAIRAYASFLVYSNRNLFSGAYKAVAGKSSIFPYDKASEWRSYWSMLLGRQVDTVRKTLLAYYDIKSKIPSMLRHDPASRRRLQSKYEQQKWLESLGIELLNKQKRSMVIYPPNLPLTVIEMEELRYEADELHRLANECQNNPKGKLTLDLDSVSWVNPEVLESKFSIILVELLFMNLRPFLRDQLVVFLTSLFETPFIKYAKPLRLALTDTSSREHWGKLVLDRDVVALSADIEQCAGFFRESRDKKSAPAQTPEDAMEIEKEEDDESEGYAITTQLYNDNTDIDEVDIPALKASQDGTVLNSAIRKLHVFKASLDDSIRRISGSREATKRKQIAKGIFTLSSTDILRLYSQASFDLYNQLLPDIDDKKNYQALHDLITKRVLVSTNINDLERMLAALSSTNQHEIERELGRVRITTTQDNTALAYEAYINSRLENQQVVDTRTLINTRKEKGSAKLLQRIMSSGKTFVYGTCLAVGRADGHHLSMLVVPKSLYSSEATNIIMRTMGAFGYDGFSFEVSRQKSDAKTLGWIYRSMQKAIKERKYLIIPPETLLILQNMFFEESMGQTVTPKYTALRKILLLLRSRGVVVFDEVDTLFNPKHELNSPISSSLHSDSSADLLNLHGLFIAEIFTCELAEEVGRIQDICQNILITKETYKKVIPEIAKILVKKLQNDSYQMDILNNPRMPRGMFKHTSEDELFEFLTMDPVQFSKCQPIFSRLEGIQLNLLSLCRLAIQDWIYMAWNGNVNENYGFSQDPSIAYAIPYMGANNPKTGSEFSFRWYSYTRTIRMYLVLGFDKSSFARSFRWIQKRYSEEEDSSKARICIESLFDLRAEDLENLQERDVEGLHEKMKAKKQTIPYYQYLLEWIVADVMPSIQFYQQQISSNAHDIPMMVKSYCAYSGTIPSSQQLPPMLRKYGDFNDDIIGKIREAVIRNSPPRIYHVSNGLSSMNLSMRILELTSSLEEKGCPLSAIIDVGAFFKEESNEQVAESILNGHGKKKAVLFYHQNKLVYSSRSEKNRALGPTSKTGLIQQGLQEDERVTYYDQQHTTGSDVYHHPSGVAVVIIGLKTTSRDFYQAVMRMRALLHQQKLIIMAPSDTFIAIQQFTGSQEPKAEDCLSFLDHNQEAEARKLNLMALFNIIRAQYKGAVYRALLGKPGMGCLEVGLWIKETEMDLEMMAMPRSEKNTIEIVKVYHRHLVKISQNYLDASSFEKVVQKTSNIIAKAEAEAALYEPVIATIEGQISGFQAEQMTEHQVEAAKLVELEVESTAAKAAPGKPVVAPFTIDFKAEEFPEIEDYNIHSQSLDDGFINLEKFFSSNPAFNLLSGMFDKRIYVSKGFNDVFFGSKRSLVLNVLILYKNLGESGDGLVHQNKEEDVEMIPDAAPDYDLRVVILSSFEAGNFEYSGHRFGPGFGREVFGYRSYLTSPTEPLCPVLQKQLPFDCTVLGDYESLMCEILVFGGHYNTLSQPMWQHPFADWLGQGQRKVLRSAVFRDIILDNQEWKNAVKKRLSVASSCMTSPFKHAQVVQTTPFMMLNFLNQSTPRILELFHRLGPEDPTRMILADTEAFYNLDEYGTIISSALEQALSHSMDLKLIGRLNLGLRVKPEKLLDIYSAYIMNSDLSSNLVLQKIAQLSESLALLSIAKNLSNKIEEILKKFAAGRKIFQGHPIALRALFPLITPDHWYNFAFEKIFRTLNPSDAKTIEVFYTNATPTWAVLEYFYADLVKKQFIQDQRDFPKEETLRKGLTSIKSQRFLSTEQYVAHLLDWCHSIDQLRKIVTAFEGGNDESKGDKLDSMKFAESKKYITQQYWGSEGDELGGMKFAEAKKYITQKYGLLSSQQTVQMQILDTQDLPSKKQKISRTEA